MRANRRGYRATSCFRDVNWWNGHTYGIRNAAEDVYTGIVPWGSGLERPSVES